MGQASTRRISHALGHKKTGEMITDDEEIEGRGCEVVVESLTKRYNSLTAVDNVSFRVGPGITCILGPNGSGKSTLMAMIAGALSPTSGSVRICGYSLWGGGSVEARRMIGYSPQDPPFNPLLTGLENLIYYGLLRGLSPKEARQRAEILLEAFNLKEAANKRVGSYSGGMKKKLSVASALIHDPKVILLDEPTSGLDPDARREFWGLISSIVSEEDKVVIVATHYAEEAEEISRRVIIMHRGRVVAEGSVEELKERYGPEAKISIELFTPIGDPEAVEATLKGIVERFSLASPREIIAYTRDSGSAVPRVVNAMSGRNFEVKSVKVEEPTLEDVFFNVTGERLNGNIK